MHKSISTDLSQQQPQSIRNHCSDRHEQLRKNTVTASNLFGHYLVNVDGGYGHIATYEYSLEESADHQNRKCIDLKDEGD